MLKIGKFTRKDYTNEYNPWLCPECYYWVESVENIRGRDDCKKCQKSCPAKIHNLTLESPKKVWDEAILDTFRFVGSVKY